MSKEKKNKNMEASAAVAAAAVLAVVHYRSRILRKNRRARPRAVTCVHIYRQSRASRNRNRLPQLKEAGVCHYRRLLSWTSVGFGVKN